jgi:hypothetical protein
MSPPQYGDYQFDIYFDGLESQFPKYPIDFASLEREAAEAVRSVFGPGPLPAHGPWVHVYTIPHDQWAQDGRVPDWEGFRALLRADSPEKADEALALIYGPGRHTAAVWDSHSS